MLVPENPKAPTHVTQKHTQITKERGRQTGRQKDRDINKKKSLKNNNVVFVFFGGVVNIGSKFLTNKILYRNLKHK